MNTSKNLLPKGDTSSAYDSPTFNLNMSIKVDAPVGSMSISPSSRDVVLASQLGLHIVDLDNPYDPPRFLPHLTAWSVADVQWSPHASHSHWVVSTSNQKAIVWNLALPSRKAIELVLHSHTRAITDINFSAHQPNVLATCSVDSFVHCWDLRTPQRPVMSFCDWFAGATQVKYNRQNEHILASSHDRYLYIWDNRMGMHAVRKISAHSTKIYGVDWNRTRPSGIVTCALDRTVKFWDYDQCPDDTPERIIHTSFPVWRARHTPFGRGLLTMAQRDDTSLYLWDRRATKDESAQPVHKFSDHTDYVKEFLWRWRGGEREDTGDDREFQLVTWSLDKDIRLWNIDQEIMEKIGHDPKKKMRFRVTRRGAEYKTFRDEAAVIKIAGGKRGPTPMGGMRHLTRLSIGGIDVEKEALKGGWKDSLFPCQGQGGRSGVVSPQSGGSLGKQLSMGSLSGDGLGLVRGNMKQGGFMRAGRKRRKEINPITWMRGVKISRKIPVGGGESEGIRNSTGRSGLFGIGWEVPETLGDEISLVGVKFPKINFEKVNIAARSCTISLNGPWGADKKWIFLRADVSFPNEYPGDGSSLPNFKLEKTNMIPEKSFDEICMQLKRISQAHVGKKRVCLEPCLCYLLGERAEDAAWVGDSDDGGESSSDDGEGIATLGSRDGEEEENVGVVDVNNQANVPLPKACGATWSNDGRLVCFFPPKEERFGTRSLLGSLTVKDDERPTRHNNNGRAWESFGRLYTASPNGRKAAMTSEAEGDTTDSTYSTTSSSSSDDDSDSIADGPLRPSIGWRLHGSIGKRFNRGGSTDRSTQRSTGTGVKTITGNLAKPKNVVSIHNMQSFLPAKKVLAQDYQVYGDSAEVCQFNAGIAEKHGCNELADVWRLVEMVLRNEVPLEVYPHPGLSSGTNTCEDRILVVAKRASLFRGRRDSGLGLDMSDEEVDDMIDPEFWGRVKWGSHPLGGKWLVDELFAYFEKRADVQMLAMLSCVFCETDEPSGSEDGGLRAPFNEASLSTRASAYARDYFPSIDMALRAHSSNNSISPNYNSATLTPIGTHGSYSSTGTGHFGSDPAYPYSTGTTPPLHGYRLGSGEDAFHSLSSSPELHHHSRKSNSAMTAYLPPGARRKMPSPAESMLGPFTATSGVTWGAITTFGSGSKEDVNSDLTETSSEFGEPSSIRITMMNLEKFDDEGNVHVPFLDPKKFRLYKSYRENYADLLFNWGLQIQRLEVLKYNGLKNAASEALEDEPVGFSRKPTEVSETSGQCFKGLELGGHCFKCGAMLISTKGARGECKPCKRRQVTMNCCVCDVIIKGLYVPCLQCGHVGHADCQEAWFAEDGVVECPTGCGCQCASFVEGGFRFTNFSVVRPLREERMHARREIGYNDYYDNYDYMF